MFPKELTSVPAKLGYAIAYESLRKQYKKPQRFSSQDIRDLKNTKHTGMLVNNIFFAEQYGRMIARRELEA